MKEVGWGVERGERLKKEKEEERVSRWWREFKGVGFHLHRRVALGEKGE